MRPVTILWPMVALAALTFAVMVRMYLRRVAEMRARRIHPQSLAVGRDIAVLQDTAAADNFRNLFELPVLFYAACLALFVAGAVTALQVALAWAFVVLRAGHSLVHVTYNRVMHRFQLYLAGAACLLAMWVALAVQLALRA